MLWSVWTCSFKYNHRASLFPTVTSPAPQQWTEDQLLSCKWNTACRCSLKCHSSRIPSLVLFYFLSLKSIIYLWIKTYNWITRFTIEIHKNEVHYEEIKVSKLGMCVCVYRSLMGFSIKCSGMKAAVLHCMLISFTRAHGRARLTLNVSLVRAWMSQSVTNSEDKCLCFMFPATRKHTR